MENKKGSFVSRYFANARRVERIEFFILLAVLIAVDMIFVLERATFFVLDDEFGYFANAAHMVGMDWSSTAGHIAYYSYGYSFLLVPLMLVFKTAGSLYTAALLLNVAFIGCCFALSKQVAKKLAPELSGRLLNIVCLAVCVYPSYIVFTKVAHTEILQYTVFWLLTYMVIVMAESPKHWKLALLALVTVYAYMVHQRALGMAAAVCIAVVIMALKKRIKWTQFAAFVLVAGVCFGAHVLIKNGLVEQLRGSSGISEQNNFGVLLDSSKTSYVFSAPGIKNMIKRLTGQIFYLTCSTLIIGLFGFLAVVCRNIDTIRFTSRKKGTDSLREDPRGFAYIFLLLGVVLTMGISVYFVTMEGGRADTMMYGRYNEVIVGPVLLLGFIEVLQNKKHMGVKAVCTVAFAALVSLLAFKFVSSMGTNVFAETSCISLYYIPRGGQFWDLLRDGFVGVLVFTLFVVIVGRFTKFKYIAAAAVLCVGGVFVRTGIKNTKEVVMGMNGIDCKYAELVNAAKEDGEDWPIYYVTYAEFTHDRPSAFVQLAMMDEPLICISKDELAKNTEDKYLLVYNEINEDTVELTQDYELLMMASELMLLKTGSTDAEEGLAISGFMTSDNGSPDELGGYTSMGGESVFLFGPYINISAGEYTVTATVECMTKDADKLGYIEVVSGGGNSIWGIHDIYADELDENGVMKVSIPIGSEENFRGVEVRACDTKGTVLRVSDIRLEIGNGEETEK